MSGADGGEQEAVVDAVAQGSWDTRSWPAGADQPRGGGVSRVLVVDDDENIRVLLDAHLNQLGHRVVSTASASEALAVVADRGLPDIAVLDVNLPDIDGFELAARLRSAAGDRRLPIIFLSARVDEADINEGRRNGAVYLTKPYVRNALRNAIDKAMAQPRVS